jgi:hypothetical protein
MTVVVADSCRKREGAWKEREGHADQDAVSRNTAHTPCLLSLGNKLLLLIASPLTPKRMQNPVISKGLLILMTARLLIV